jgi:hypothetical protein
MESTGAKVGKVLRVAEALPHSEGAAYKLKSEIAACLQDWRMGSYKATTGGRDHTTGPEPRTPGVERRMSLEQWLAEGRGSWTQCQLNIP